MNKKRIVEKNIVEPMDGGWAWIVCFGSSLITLSLRSLDPSFGLLFGDLLEDLGVATTGAAIVQNVLEAMVNLSGLFIGPLIKKFSYRNVAIFGSMLSCTGLMLTSRANSLVYIIFTYSVLGGLGTGLAITSAFVALNSYFKKKKGQAVGFSMAGTTTAMMIMPQAVHFLLIHYDFRGAMLIIGGAALHAVLGACLLRPVSRGEKLSSTDGKDEIDVTDENTKERETLLVSREKNDDSETRGTNESHETMKTEETKGTRENRIKKHGIVEKIVNFFDLDLLRSSSYVNVLLGLSLFYVSEMNFKFITPFFLRNIGMDRGQVATCLSVTAFADIISRILLPTFFDKMEFKKRNIFWVASILLAFGRSVMAELRSGYFLMGILIFNGFVRGAALTNLNLTVSETCTQEKLPAAMGMFMVSKGVLIATMGPLIGVIRDASGSYSVTVHALSAAILLCSVIWSIEFFIKTIKSRKYSTNERKTLAAV